MPKKKNEKPTIKTNCRLVELGLDEDYGGNVLRMTVAGSPDTVITIPTTQQVVKQMAPFLYEKVVLTLEVL